MNKKNQQAVANVRSFSRTFTRHMGLLNKAPYAGRLNLLQARILFEVATQPHLRAYDLSTRLAMDKGHISRSLQQMAKWKMLKMTPDGADQRSKKIVLTAIGRRHFKNIDRMAQNLTAQLLNSLGGVRTEVLSHALTLAEWALDGSLQQRARDVVLRDFQAGDLGWMIQRHGEIYFAEYGWNQDFETLVAEIALNFFRQHDPRRERGWIAEAHGVRLGCVLVVDAGDGVAKLRILLVEPLARGLGVGARLVKECLTFARTAGYKQMTLWTNDILTSARRIYEAEGFVLERSEPHHSFGHDLIGQYWTKKLSERG